MKSVATKFLLPVTVISVVLCVFLLCRGHASAERQTMRLLHEQASMALEFDLAIRDYVGREIRPCMEQYVDEDEFIPETMSTSFVARRIFESVRERFPDYIIKFSSDDARNPANAAGVDELRMIEYFNDHPDVDRWTGAVYLDGNEYLAHFSARRMKESCLHCHGEPENAPASLLARYGATAGFHRPVGEIVALDTIAVPMTSAKAASLAETAGQSVAMIVGFALLLVSVVITFRLVVGRRLRLIAAHFRRIAEQPESARIVPVQMDSRDEIGVLAGSFNALALRLREAHACLERRVAQRTEQLEQVNQGLQREIKQRERAETARRDRLDRVWRQHSAIVQLASEQALVAGDFEQAVKRITEVACDALQLERGGVWLFDEQRRRLRCVDLFVRSQRQHAHGGIVHVAEHPSYFTALETRRAVDARNARSDPRTRDFTEGYLIPAGITSVLDSAIRVSGELVGVVRLEHVGEPRTWTDDMTTFAGELADQAAQALMSRDRKMAERRLRAISDQRRELEHVVNHSPAVAFLRRAEEGFPVEYVSDNIRQFGYSPDQLLSRELLYRDLVHPDDITRIAAEVDQHAESGREDFCQQYRIVTAGGDARWVEDRTWIRRDAAGRVTHYQGIVLDITARVHADEALRLDETRLEAMLELNQMTRASIQELSDFALEQAVRLTSSEIGYLAFVEDDESVLAIHSWSKNAMDQCRIADKQFTYSVEETGLWGEAIRQRRPVITNDYDAPNPLKRGCPEGHVPIKRHLSVPVFDGKRIVALAGVGNKDRDYDEADVRQLTLLLDGVWKIIRRTRAEEELEAERRQLVSMFDGLDEPVYVADPETHELMYMNAAARNQWGDGVGRKCYEALQGLSAPCPFCTNDRLFGEDSTAAYIWEFHNRRNARWYRCIDRAIRWSDGRMVRFEMAIDVTDRKRAEEQLRHDALHDTLTGLANRSLLLERVKTCVARHARDPEYRFALLFVDLDRFKVINDSLGHAAGDHLLVSVAERLRDCLRATDAVARLEDQTIARVGGDEFVVLLDGLRDHADAPRVAQRLLDEITRPVVLGDQELFISASIGIAPCNKDYRAADEILRDADTAMYRAKEGGKARYAVFDHRMHARAMERLRLENDLRRALDQRQLSLQYQPIVSVYSNEVVGFEALLRWQHPDDGAISPAKFVPIAEETGLIVPIGRWVLQEACGQLCRWRQRYPLASAFSISVNVSKRQIIEPRFIDEIKETLRENHLTAEDLAVEITESVVTESPKSVAPVLEELRTMGISLHMDDFGTGESSLSCLHHYPISVLKIDREFISSMQDSEDYAAVVNAIIALAHHMGLRVVAEGVETGEQMNQVIMMNCDYCQGYYFAPPLDVPQVDALIAADAKLLRSA